MKTKTRTKALILSVCAVLLAVTSVLGTLAYLKSQDAVTNTFTIGKVAITLDEQPVDEYGTAQDGARVKANRYKLIPGHSYQKDPTVHLAANSEASWLFVKVENGLATAEGGSTIASQIAANGWTALEGVTGVYYKQAAKTGASAVDYAVFQSFALKNDVALDAFANASIKETAYAIQADGFVTAAQAWTAGAFTA